MTTKVRSKKKASPTIIFIGVALISLVAWVIFSITEPPVWKGNSADGSIEIDFVPDLYSPKGEWQGHLYAKRQVNIHSISIFKDGVQIHELLHDSIISPDNPVSYIYSYDYWDKEDAIQAEIRWSDEEGVYEETVLLAPKTRWFVFPRNNSLFTFY